MNNKEILLLYQSDIKSKLIDAAVKLTLQRLLSAVASEDILDLIKEDNDREQKKAKTRIVGSSSSQIIDNLAVDDMYNIIYYNEKLAGRVAHYLHSNRVSFNKGAIKDSLGAIRTIRNACAHVKDATNIKTAAQGAAKIMTIRDFMGHFKTLYKDLFDAYSLEEAKLLDLLKDYAEKNGENLDSFSQVFIHSGMIEMGEFAQILSETALEGLDADKIRSLVFQAVLEQNIIHRELRFAKCQSDMVKSYILRHASSLSLSEGAAQSLKNSMDDTDSAEKLKWIFDSGLDEGELLNLVNQNNILIDIRYLDSSDYIEFLVKRIIPYMSKESYLFATPSLNEYNLSHYGQGNQLYDDFINNYGGKITLFELSRADEASNIVDIVNEKFEHDFLILTMDAALSDRFATQPFNGRILNIAGNLQPFVEDDSINDSVAASGQEEVYYEPADNASYYQPQLSAYQGQTMINSQYAIENQVAIETASNDFALNQNTGVWDIEPAIYEEPVQKKSSKKDRNALFDKKNVDPYLEDEALEVIGKITSGSVVFDKSGQTIKLSERVGGGGEGDVYDCSRPGLVAKIYSPHANTRNRKEKLELMSSRQIEMEGICWPIDTLYNSNRQFVGYLMKKVSGIDFDRMVSNIGKPMERRGWDRKKLVTCLINIMSMFEYLHKNNIIVGDINGANIMIEDYDKVYLVDTDSFQLDKYPCQVEKMIYMDPTLRLTEGERHAYTIEEDQYKLAIIAYLMLMPGQMPYAITEGESGGVFRFTEKGAKITAKPLYNYIWSNMEWSVKNLFLRVFDNDERNITARRWITALNAYLSDIGDNEERNKIRIEVYRGSGFEEDVKCSRCGGRLNLTVAVAKERIAKFGEENILCRDCSISDGIDKSKTVYMRCNKCKRLLTVSESYLEARKARGAKMPDCDLCGNGKGARPVYNIPRLSDVMMEMGD